MVNVTMDSRGELRSLWVVPPARAEDPESMKEVDWAALFELAGLDLESFASVAPEFTPRVFCDVLAAWKGRYPGQEDPAIRIEACALGGRPVEFRIVHPWSTPRGGGKSSPSDRVGRLIFFALFVALALGAAVMARRNLRMGRGDRRGAARIATFLAVTTMVGWTLTFDHVSMPLSQFMNVVGALGFALFMGLALWLFYIAMEPPVRRLWPQLLVSWSRVLAGRFRDPLVGAHILLGALLGLAGRALLYGYDLAARELGYPLARPVDVVWEQFHSPGWFLGDAIRSLGQDLLFPTIMMFFFLVFLYFVLRRRWLATMGFVSVSVLSGLVSSENPLLLLPFSLLVAGLAAVAFVRLGLLGGLAMTAMVNLPENYLLTSDSSAWYFGYSLTTFALCVSLIIYSFWVSLGGQSVFGDPRHLSAAGSE